jgi:hypothetical protein
MIPGFAPHSFGDFLGTLWPLAVVLAWIAWRLWRLNRRPAPPVSRAVESLLSPEERLKLHRVNHPPRYAPDRTDGSGPDGIGSPAGSSRNCDGDGNDDGGGD